MDLEKDRHPRIDQLKIPSQLQTCRESTDKASQLREAVMDPGIKRPDLEVCLGRRKRLEMLDQRIEAARRVTIFQELGYGRSGRGRASDRSLRQP